MATISHVEAALAGLIDTALYPGGHPSTSVAGHPVKIYAGWPDPDTLEADVAEASGVPAASHVSIYPLPGERNTTRFPVEREELPAPAVTYSLTASGQTVTVGGAAPATYVPQNLAVWINGVAYVVQAQAGDAPSTLAAALAALIVVDIAGATASGAVITLPAGARIGALTLGSTGSTVREVRRQARQFQISVWSSNPTARAAVADAFDAILADTPRLALADGSTAWLDYHGGREDDFTQKQRIYRRSLIYTVEYPTTITETAPQIVAGKVEVPAVAVIDILDFTDAGDADLLSL